MEPTSRKSTRDIPTAMDYFGKITPPLSYLKPKPKEPEPEELVPEISLRDFDRSDPINWSRRILPAKTPLLPVMIRLLRTYQCPNLQVKIGKYEFKCQLLLLQCYSKVFEKVDGMTTNKIEFDEKIYSANGFAIAYNWMMAKDNVEAFKLIQHDNLLDVFNTAIQLEIPELEQFCWMFISSEHFYDEDTAFLMYIQVDGEKRESIQELMVPKIRNFFLTLVATSEFLELRVESVKKFMKSNYIVVWSEMEVFMTGVRWLIHNWEEREKYTIEVMACVRFALICPMELISLGAQPEFQAIIEIPEVNQLIMDGLYVSLAKPNFDCRVVAIRGGRRNLPTEEVQADMEKFQLMLPEGRNWGGYQRTYKSYNEFLLVLQQCKEYYLYMRKHYVRAFPLTSGEDEEKWCPPKLLGVEASDDDDLSIKTLTDTYSCTGLSISDSYVVETPLTSKEALTTLGEYDDYDMDMDTWMQMKREEELMRILNNKWKEDPKIKKEKEEEIRINQDEKKEEKLMQDLINFDEATKNHETPVLKTSQARNDVSFLMESFLSEQQTTTSANLNTQSITNPCTQKKSTPQNEKSLAFLSQLMSKDKTNVKPKSALGEEHNHVPKQLPPINKKPANLEKSLEENLNVQDKIVEDFTTKEQLKQQITAKAQLDAQNITDQSNQKMSISQNKNLMELLSQVMASDKTQVISQSTQLVVNDKTNVKSQSAGLYKCVTKNLPPAQQKPVNSEESYKGNNLPIKHLNVEDKSIDTFEVNELLKKLRAATVQLEAQNITFQNTLKESTPQNETSLSFLNQLSTKEKTNEKTQSAKCNDRGDSLTENLPLTEQKPANPEAYHEVYNTISKMNLLDKNVQAFVAKEQLKQLRAATTKLDAQTIADQCTEKNSLPQSEEDPLALIRNIMETQKTNIKCQYSQGKERSDYPTKSLPPVQQKPANPEASHEVYNTISKLNLLDKNVQAFVAKEQLKRQRAATTQLDAQTIADQCTEKNSFPQSEEDPLALIRNIMETQKTNIKCQYSQGKERSDYPTKNLPPVQQKPANPEASHEVYNTISKLNLLDKNVQAFAVKEQLKQLRAATTQLDAQTIAGKSTLNKSTLQNETLLAFLSQLSATEKTNVKSQSANVREEEDYPTKNLPPAQQKPSNPRELTNVISKLNLQNKSIETFAAKEQLKQQRPPTAQLDAQNVTDQNTEKKNLLPQKPFFNYKIPNKRSNVISKSAQRVPLSLGDIYNPDDLPEEQNSVANRSQPQTPNSFPSRNEVPHKSPYEATRKLRTPMNKF